jgi:hypothetical protein
MNATKKITLATFKAFVRKNRSVLEVKCESSFDGMVDGVRRNEGAAFRPIQPSQWGNEDRNTLGINGVWLVGSSRDSFSHYADGERTGIEVYNCCGSFILAIQNKYLGHDLG